MWHTGHFSQMLHMLNPSNHADLRCEQNGMWLKEKKNTYLVLDHGGAFPNCRQTNWSQSGVETFVTVLKFQTSCFETSHGHQHSVRYPASSGSVETTYAAPPCDFNWVIRCNSISNRRAMRVSVRRKAKEHWWVESLSVTLHHRSYLSG